jgi:hypothetical protein
VVLATVRVFLRITLSMAEVHQQVLCFHLALYSKPRLGAPLAPCAPSPLR